MLQLRNMKNCKLQALSTECRFGFIGQGLDEINPFSSLRYCLWPSKWHVRRSTGHDSRSIAKLRYPSEPSFDAESKFCTHLIVAQPTRELQPDFTSILSLRKLKSRQHLIFDLTKTVWPMSHPSRTPSTPAALSCLLDVKISTWTNNFAVFPLLLDV